MLMMLELEEQIGYVDKWGLKVSTYVLGLGCVAMSCEL